MQTPDTRISGSFKTCAIVDDEVNFIKSSILTILNKQSMLKNELVNRLVLLNMV